MTRILHRHSKKPIDRFGRNFDWITCVSREYPKTWMPGQVSLNWRHILYLVMVPQCSYMHYSTCCLLVSWNCRTRDIARCTVPTWYCCTTSTVYLRYTESWYNTYRCVFVGTAVYFILVEMWETARCSTLVLVISRLTKVRPSTSDFSVFAGKSNYGGDFRHRHSCS